MIQYRVDEKPYANTNKQIKDMQYIINEIAPTLEVLHNLLRQHETLISSPSINNYRNELLSLLSQTTQLAKSVSKRAEKLTAVSDQTSNHLRTIEEHFSTVLYQPDQQNADRFN